MIWNMAKAKNLYVSICQRKRLFYMLYEVVLNVHVNELKVKGRLHCMKVRWVVEEVLMFDFSEKRHSSMANLCSFACAVAYFPAMMNVKCFEKFANPFKNSERELVGEPKSGGNHLSSYAWYNCSRTGGVSKIVLSSIKAIPSQLIRLIYMWEWLICKRPQQWQWHDMCDCMYATK